MALFLCLERELQDGAFPSHVHQKYCAVWAGTGEHLIQKPLRLKDDQVYLLFFISDSSCSLSSASMAVRQWIAGTQAGSSSFHASATSNTKFTCSIICSFTSPVCCIKNSCQPIFMFPRLPSFTGFSLRSCLGEVTQTWTLIIHSIINKDSAVY